MCRAIMMRGSVHSTIHPSLSPTLPTSGLRKWLGIRLQITGVSIWTSSLGGHWGTGLLCSLRNIAAEMGMMFWHKRDRGREVYDQNLGQLHFQWREWKQGDYKHRKKKHGTLWPLVVKMDAIKSFFKMLNVSASSKLWRLPHAQII